MAERPILFSAPMVRALLAGQKTQTRRAVKPQPTHPLFGNRLPFMLVPDDEGEDLYLHSSCLGSAIRCPYGQPGDRLWVREAFIHEPADYCWEASVSIPCSPASTVYRADAEDPRGGPWKSPIHMPRALSRITLEVTGVRVERLQAINRGDAMAEGCQFANMAAGPDPREWYRELWDQINGDGAWAANPWVWAVSFRVVKP